MQVLMIPLSLLITALHNGKMRSYLSTFGFTSLSIHWDLFKLWSNQVSFTWDPTTSLDWNIDNPEEL